MVLGSYRQLWAQGEAGVPDRMMSVVLLFLAIGFPIALISAFYEPIFALAAVGSVALIVVGALFYNLHDFVVFCLPLIYLYPNYRIIYVMLILMVISFTATRLKTAQLSLDIPHPLLLIMILILGLNGLSRTVNPEGAKYLFTLSLIAPILIFLVVFNLKPSVRSIRSSLLIICIGIALLGWASFAYYIQTGVPRRFLAWPSQNPAACFLGMIFPYAIISVIDAKSVEERLLWIWITLGLGTGILVTQTRAALFAVAGAMLYIAWKDKRVFRILFPAIIIAVVALPSILFSRLFMLFGKGVAPDWSSVGRIQIWSNSLNLIPQYFFFGMGFDSFRMIYPAVFPFSFIRAEHPHNMFLNGCLTTGFSE
jgi:O-antigen ligase